MGANNKDKLDALLAEYNTLRTESLAGIDNRYKIITFTFGALSVLLAGLLTRQVPDMLSGIIALFIVPQIAKASLLMWLGEYNRSMRSGRAIMQIEIKINEMLHEQLLRWESGLATKKTHMGYPYIATIIFVLGGGYVGSLLGVYLITSPEESFTGLTLILLLWVVLIESIFLMFVNNKWREARKQQ